MGDVGKLLNPLDKDDFDNLLNTGISKNAAVVGVNGVGALAAGFYLNNEPVEKLEKSSGVHATIFRMNEALAAKLDPLNYHKNKLDSAAEFRKLGVQIFNTHVKFYEKRGYSSKDAKAYALEKYKDYISNVFDEIDDNSSTNALEKLASKESKKSKKIKNVDNAGDIVVP